MKPPSPEFEEVLEKSKLLLSVMRGLVDLKEVQHRAPTWAGMIKKSMNKLQEAISAYEQSRIK